jgi:hypothetical protein
MKKHYPIIAYPILPVSNPNREPAMQALPVANTSLQLKTSLGMAFMSALVRNRDMMMACGFLSSEVVQRYAMNEVTQMIAE